MSSRKVPLIDGEIYHIFTKSIAGYKIFNSREDFKRMLETLDFYRLEKTPCRLSNFLELKNDPGKFDLRIDHNNKIVNILAYCLMPTHIHFILRQLKKNGISKYINLVLKSYSKYFNVRYKRKGSLWEGRFKNVLVESDEQFLHLTRYIHLNPVSSFLIDNPHDWEFSSYREYTERTDNNINMCDPTKYLTMDIPSYKRFVNDHIDYQRELEKIKHLALE